jgi:hypothetical protein
MANKTTAEATTVESTIDPKDRLAQAQTDNGRKKQSSEYQDGVDAGIRATLAEAVEYLDQCIVAHGSAGYVNVLKQIREEFVNTKY